jgi:predicted nucleic acid-binding protein
MLVSLDTVICIYAVEGAPSFQAKARARLAGMPGAGEQPAISDLTWLECRVKPIRLGDAVALANMEAFLTGSDVVRVPMPTVVYERACRIRAVHNYRLADALHLAAAVVRASSSCPTPGTCALPNAWDVASARVFEEAGFPAVGTTSAGVAWALGYPDGELVSRDEVVEVPAHLRRRGRAGDSRRGGRLRPGAG